jgi:hypothetical protein
VLASDLKPDMTAGSISDVVAQAVAVTDMRQLHDGIAAGEAILRETHTLYLDLTA